MVLDSTRTLIVWGFSLALNWEKFCWVQVWGRRAPCPHAHTPTHPRTPIPGVRCAHEGTPQRGSAGFPHTNFLFPHAPSRAPDSPHRYSSRPRVFVRHCCPTPAPVLLVTPSPLVPAPPPPQVIGFLVLILGTVVYNELVYIPGIMEKPDASKDEMKMVRARVGGRDAGSLGELTLPHPPTSHALAQTLRTPRASLAGQCPGSLGLSSSLCDPQPQLPTPYACVHACTPAASSAMSWCCALTWLAVFRVYVVVCVCVWPGACAYTVWHQKLLGDDVEDNIHEPIDQLMTPSMQKVTAVHAR
jgi:hypothetical protein